MNLFTYLNSKENENFIGEDLFSYLLGKEKYIPEPTNIFDGEMENDGFNADGINNPPGASVTRIRSKNYIPIEELTEYVISYVNNSNFILRTSLSFYTVDDYVTPRIENQSWNTDNPRYFTTPAGAKYMRFLISGTHNEVITVDDASDIVIEKVE